jgi:hypothetical protein
MFIKYELIKDDLLLFNYSSCYKYLFKFYNFITIISINNRNSNNQKILNTLRTFL